MDWRVRKICGLLSILASVAVPPGLAEGEGSQGQQQPPQPQQPQPGQPPPYQPQPGQPQQGEYKSAPIQPYQEAPKPPGPGPKYENDNACKYDDPPWSDCDPFHLMRWRNKKLVSGVGCDLNRNESRQCGPDHFPPATKWLIAEHKKCVQQLEHLKNMIGDLHRWIDLIHERGQAMYHAFNELRKHLEDIQRQIRELHRQNHDNHVLLQRLRKELDEWKDKCRKQQIELEELKSRYTRLEKEHLKMKSVFQDMQVANEACKRDQRNLNKKINSMLSENRELKGKLMDAERFKELVTRAQQRISAQTDAIAQIKREIAETKESTTRCRIDVMNARNRKPPKFNKDTHVNLDMQMWITHNQTREDLQQQQQHDQKGQGSGQAGSEKELAYQEYKRKQQALQGAQVKNYMENYGGAPVHVATIQVQPGKQQPGQQQQQQHPMPHPMPPQVNPGLHPKQSPPPPPLPPQHPPVPAHPPNPPHPPSAPRIDAKLSPSSPSSPTTSPPTTPTPHPNRKVHAPPPPPAMPPPPPAPTTTQSNAKQPSPPQKHPIPIMPAQMHAG